MASLSGWFLFLSDYPAHLWWLQCLALLPWLWGLLKFAPGKKVALLAGAFVGLCYTVPLLVALEFPLLESAGLSLYLTALWAVLSFGARVVLAWPPVIGGLAVGAVAVLVEWVDFTVVPVWGTSQSFVRVFSAFPWAIQFVSLTGMLGLVFVLVGGQALLANILARPGARRAPAIALGLLLGLPAVFNTLSWFREPQGFIRVAAAGWTYDFGDNPGEKDPLGLLRSRVDPLVRRAAADGARLVVLPEVGFVLAPELKPEWLSAIRALATEQQVLLAVGYFDRQRNDNRLLWIDSSGTLLGEYRKTHLIPLIERYQAGDGTLLTLPLNEVLLGSMICQDDNFTDLAREYGKLATQVIAVPTNDWEQVKDYHLENSIFRAVENRYAVVRAATNGVSAIITARGQVLARLDPFQEGAGLIVAKLPVFAGGTFYSLTGDWMMLGGSFGLLILAWLRRRQSNPNR